MSNHACVLRLSKVHRYAVDPRVVRKGDVDIGHSGVLQDEHQLIQLVGIHLHGWFVNLRTRIATDHLLEQTFSGANQLPRPVPQALTEAFRFSNGGNAKRFRTVFATVGHLQLADASRGQVVNQLLDDRSSAIHGNVLEHDMGIDEVEVTLQKG